MIYTLTLNPAIDKTVQIPMFSPGAVNRIQSMRSDVGGKGINVSKCLAVLGCQSTAAAFWGGKNGERGIRFLEDAGICAMPVLVSGETRTNLKIVDPERGQNTDINEPGPLISDDDLENLCAQLDSHIHSGDILVLSGSIPRGLPPTVYRDLILRYKAAGALVFLDADGTSFREGIKASPFSVKPNIDELCSYCGSSLTTVPEMIAAARNLLEQGVTEAVISLGSEGALLVNRSHCYRAQGLRVPVISTVGAGDSMVAALTYGLEMGYSDRERLALAVAISASSVMCSGTQAPDPETIRQLFHQVAIEEVK